MMARNIAGHKINYTILDIRNNRLTLQVIIINCMLHDLIAIVYNYVYAYDQSSTYVCVCVLHVLHTYISMHVHA